MSTDIKSDALIARWIDPKGRKPGPADAWVLPGFVPVWAIITQLRLGGWNSELVAADYELPVEAAEAAVAFYHRHWAEVDARIERNRARLGS